MWVDVGITMDAPDLNEMMAAICARKEQIEKAEAEKIIGAPGPRGERGSSGLPARLFVGTVIESDKAAASVSPIEGKENEYRLNLWLPRGRDGQNGDRGASGAASTVAGPAGSPGRDAQPPSQEDIEKVVHKVLEANVEKFRGERGASVVGERGEPGQSGRTPKIEIGTCTTGNEPSAKFRIVDGVHYLDLVLQRGPSGPRGEIGPIGKGERGSPGESIVGPTGPAGESIQGPPGLNAYPTDEMLTDLIINVLTKVIGTEIIFQKLAAVKAELAREVHNATSRHAAALSDTYRRVSNIIG